MLSSSFSSPHSITAPNVVGSVGCSRSWNCRLPVVVSLDVEESGFNLTVTWTVRRRAHMSGENSSARRDILGTA